VKKWWALKVLIVSLMFHNFYMFVDLCQFQPFLGSGEASNKISGKIKLGTETLASLDGRWDAEVYIKDRTNGVR
jgi:hypothetical protein